MITGRAAKEVALKQMMEFLFPGCWAECWKNYSQEIKATTVVSMTIEEATTETHDGGPVDDEEDYETSKI